MFSILYQKSTGKILSHRHDTSSVINKLSLDVILEDAIAHYSSIPSGVSSDDLAVTEIDVKDWPGDDKFVYKKYDEVTKTIVDYIDEPEGPTLALRTIPFTDPLKAK
jgi:hypothetical protein